METQFTNNTNLVFQVNQEKISFFTLLLQSGIIVKTTSGTSIGKLLQTLPDFTSDYIVNDVQTIFLNGTATDDLETVFENDGDTLAISAAMPGLAGAIFRKNSLHAALRTTQEREHIQTSGVEITVIVKFFNAIARDRGRVLLSKGVNIHADSVVQFFNTRTTLPGFLESVTLNRQQLTPEELMPALTKLDTVHLTII